MQSERFTHQWLETLTLVELDRTQSVPLDAGTPHLMAKVHLMMEKALNWCPKCLFVLKALFDTKLLV